MNKPFNRTFWQKEFYIQSFSIRKYSKLQTSFMTYLAISKYSNIIVNVLFFILQSGQMDNILTETEKLALIIACLCHDLDHRGTNNQFQIKWVPSLKCQSKAPGTKSWLVSFVMHTVIVKFKKHLFLILCESQ